MKHFKLASALVLVLVAVLSFTTPKPRTFADDFGDFEFALSNYKVVKQMGGDTVAAKLQLIALADAVESHGDVTENLKNYHDGHKDCVHVCTQAAVGCIRMIFMLDQCMALYDGCMEICSPKPN